MRDKSDKREERRCEGERKTQKRKGEREVEKGWWEEGDGDWVEERGGAKCERR